MAKRSDFEEIIYNVPWYVSLIIGLFILAFTGGIFKILGFVLLLASFLSILRTLSNEKMMGLVISLDDIKKISWDRFEDLVETYYKRNGYNVIHRGDAFADGGVDIEAYKNGKKTIIQCKHWNNRKIDVHLVREMYGVMMDEKADETVIITSGEFTQPAIDFASGKPIKLINGRKLLKMILELEHGELAKLKQNFLPVCPYCNKKMVLRKARKGIYRNKLFWGCVNYPSCKYKIPYSD